jgi:hypothetical protein
MIRKSTGVVFSPQEFRELNNCLGCGRALKIAPLEKCQDCRDKNLTPCEMCEIILETGIHTHYTYDIRENKREGDREQYVSKESMREFLETEEVDNKYSNTLCKSCQDWENRIKDICWMCDNDFSNTKENYKLNGNMCEICSPQFQ